MNDFFKAYDVANNTKEDNYQSLDKLAFNYKVQNISSS
jgi:hypothetical protein